MISLLASPFSATASALVWSLARVHAPPGDSAYAPPYNDLTRFVLEQHARLPDYLGGPMTAAALAFDLAGCRSGGKPFHAQLPENRQRQIAAWRSSPAGFQRDFIRYFESLTLLALFSRTSVPGPLPPPRSSILTRPPVDPDSEIVVLGSGPGGALTACYLAEAGHDVLLLEAGPYLSLDSCEPFSRTEMVQKYRNGGQTVALGTDKIAYVEGRCVGGGSEINSGLYHRTPPEILDQWRADFQVAELSEQDLLPHFAAVERELSVSLRPGPNPAAALKLHAGAGQLGWKSFEVPRWYRYPAGAEPAGPGRRQSMTETYIPRFLRAGGRLLPQTTVRQIRQDGAWWTMNFTHLETGPGRLSAEKLFVCGGAVQTPALLRRSGITDNVGNSLRVHPTVKLVAEFPDVVNGPDLGVPSHQVKEFSPRLGFGCSVSSPAYLALALLDHPGASRALPAQWPHLAVYYAMITGTGRGTVRPLPGRRDPLVRYRITTADRRDLADGLGKLGAALFAGGATAVFPAVAGSRPIRHEAALRDLPSSLPEGQGNLMTIHLFSSCPMGENPAQCATDSFGRLRGLRNLWVADASLLPGAPGVNPQGTVMALARRNVLRFLGKH